MQANEQKTSNGMMQYCVGFGLAVVLTLIAYLLVVNHWLSGVALLGTIIGLAVVQLLVQLVFFLHLGKKGSRWNLTAFFFMLIILFIVVGGSLWIMYNLNYNMQMTPEQMDKFMQQQSNAGF